MHRIILSILLTTSLFAKDIIAVLDLEQIGLTPQEATILTQRLTTELISLDKYQVVERNNMDKILKEQKFQKSGCTDSGCAVEIGQLLNTDFIVIGSVNKFGSTWTLDARLINVALGKGIISAEFSAEGKIDILLTTGLPSIAKQLCGMEATTIIQTPTQLNISSTVQPSSKLQTYGNNNLTSISSKWNRSVETMMFVFPVIATLKKDEQGNILGSKGWGGFLGYYNKTYRKPFKINVWNPYWHWGTSYFVLPYIGIGTEYVSRNGFLFGVATWYYVPYISIGKYF